MPDDALSLQRDNLPAKTLTQGVNLNHTPRIARNIKCRNNISSKNIPEHQKNQLITTELQ